MANVLTELSNFSRRLLGETIKLNVVHGRNLGYFKLDQGQLEQVIINLAVNARNAMQDGVLFVIETKNRQVTRLFEINDETVEPGEYIVLSVTDSSLGIDFVSLLRIFEPFFTTKEVSAKIGLGLSTVYEIVKQTGGHILAESEGAG